MTEKILHKELSYQIVGGIFDVHNEVGPGLREECYQKALEHRLFEKGIPFISKPRTRRELIYRGEVVDVFEPDLIIADRIVVELKHQPEGFATENISQVLCYLACWKLSCAKYVVVEPEFHDRRLPISPISPFVINGIICVQVDAISESVTARAIRTMQTHLRLTGCELGIVACFGRRTLIIRGVRP